MARGRTAREWISAMWPVAPLYSQSKVRSGTNGWKLRAITDLAKGDMIPEGQTFLRKVDILEIVVGTMKNILHKLDIEKPRQKLNTKHSGAFRFREKKSDPIDWDLNKVFPLCMDEDLIQIFIKMIGGRHYCMQLSKGTSIPELKKEI